jgi:NAD(P)H-dependent FMN reductase
MPKIVIISASVRLGRNSHRLALFFNNYITQNALATVEILDLHAYQFPIFEERLMYTENPPANLLEAAQKIKDADGVLIVTPEYNGGYPASLKNFTDVLVDEWYRKPIAIATVSNGNFAGTQVITSSLFTLWKIGALMVPARFSAPKVQEAYGEQGVPVNEALSNKLAKAFVGELLWCMEAKSKMGE